MIYLITNREAEYEQVLAENKNEIEFGSLFQFEKWWQKQEATNLDTETSVVDTVYGWEMTGPKSKRVFALDENGDRIPKKRLLYTVQVGSTDKKTQFLFENVLNFPESHSYLKRYFMSMQPKYIHNALFDNSVILFNLGVNPRNVKDTMLLSHILATGLEKPKGFHSFVGCLERYLGITLSKEEQTSFNGEAMTMNQITYAALDVFFTKELYDAMYLDIERWGLQNVVTLEEAVLRPYAHSMVDNFYLNRKEWTKNMHLQEENLNRAVAKLEQTVLEHFPTQLVEHGFLNPVDKYDFNWRSSTMVKNILTVLYPEMTATTKPLRQIYFRNIEHLPESKYLKALLQGTTDTLEKMLITDHHALLADIGVFTPAGKLTINFNSPPQLLTIFRWIKPNLEAVNKTALSKVVHPFKSAYNEYTKAAKLVQSYGQNFLDEINPDGMLRVPSYSQILVTGRSSMRLFQLLPGQNSYRNCFYYKPGFKVVSCDFASQEAVIAATICKEPTMLKIFENNWDFHSYCAAMLFPEEWQQLGGDPEPKDKPDDLLLVKRRNATKATSFGIFYGKTAIGLADTLDIPANSQELLDKYPQEAKVYLDTHREQYEKFILLTCNNKDNLTSTKEFLRVEHEHKRFLGDILTAHELIELFYQTFPNIKTVLLGGAEQAVQQNYIATKDMIQRIRFFEKPESTKEAKAIEREAMNLPVQGGGANMTKLAIAKVYKYIEDNDLLDKIKFLLPIHDEIVTVATDDLVDMWSKKLPQIMEEAGEALLGHKLQKAEVNVSDVWMK